MIRRPRSVSVLKVILFFWGPENPSRSFTLFSQVSRYGRNSPSSHCRMCHALQLILSQISVTLSPCMIDRTLDTHLQSEIICRPVWRLKSIPGAPSSIEIGHIETVKKSVKHLPQIVLSLLPRPSLSAVELWQLCC